MARNKPKVVRGGRDGLYTLLPLPIVWCMAYTRGGGRGGAYSRGCPSEGSLSSRRPVARKINRSHTHTHTHTHREQHPRHKHTRQEQHPTPPNKQPPQTLNNAQGGATRVRATSHARVGGRAEVSMGGRPMARNKPKVVRGGRGGHYGCISMQRYWSSLRYSFLRTVFCWLPTTSSSNCRPRPRHKSIYRLGHLGNTPPRSTV